jgi:Sec-independent protein translocase protein TatA
MRYRVWFSWMVALLLISVALISVAGVSAEDLPAKIERMERELEEMKRELQAQKAEQEKARAEQQAKEAAAKAAETTAPYRAITDRVQVGGYGSMRFEGSDLADQKNSFVFRRFVLTTDANIAPRLRGYFELEFERFRKLELEKTTQPQTGGLLHEQAVEGTNDSEISLEQAWLQFDIDDWVKLRAGGILVPLGRFNIAHDDNRWDLPRRSLVDRGVPVLPSTAAWDEVGMGFLGEVPLSDQALLGYQVYVMNGVSLDAGLEHKVEPPDMTGGQPTAVWEVELSPSTGGFAADVKDSKAVAGRVALSPALGHEIAGSWYYGQYTPDFLGNEDLWAVAADGRSGYGPFELEGEGVFTRFDGTGSVAASLARVARDQSLVESGTDVNTEVEFELAKLARSKYGYWLEGRYRFWPAFLSNTFLGRSFANPQLIAVVRPEQAWLDDLIEEVGFAGGTLQSIAASSRRVDRFSVGLAYRPVPLVVFQLAYEYTQTNHGQSLAGVTNYLPAQPGEDHVNTVLVGTAFGF